jgi:hypothetical protein
MLNKLVLFITSFGLLSSIVYAGESCTLSGEVTFQDEAWEWGQPLTFDK